jgi:hypothetical protein
MIFRKALWLIGAGMGLESMRRGFVGGSMLSLFVVKEFGLEKAAIPTMNALRTYLNIEEKLLSQIPPFLDFLITPFTDYHEAAKTSLHIFEILAELQKPRTCAYYWGEGDEE